MKSADRLEPSTGYGLKHKAQVQAFLDGVERELKSAKYSFERTPMNTQYTVIDDRDQHGRRRCYPAYRKRSVRWQKYKENGKPVWFQSTEEARAYYLSHPK